MTKKKTVAVQMTADEGLAFGVYQLQKEGKSLDEILELAEVVVDDMDCDLLKFMALVGLERLADNLERFRQKTEPQEGSKKCTGCEEVKDLGEFYPGRAKCKECYREEQARRDGRRGAKPKVEEETVSQPGSQFFPEGEGPVDSETPKLEGVK